MQLTSGQALWFVNSVPGSSSIASPLLCLERQLSTIHCNESRKKDINGLQTTWAASPVTAEEFHEVSEGTARYASSADLSTKESPKKT
jgi:hypothetical protein